MQQHWDLLVEFPCVVLVMCMRVMVAPQFLQWQHKEAVQRGGRLAFAGVGVFFGFGVSVWYLCVERRVPSFTVTTSFSHLLLFALFSLL